MADSASRRWDELDETTRQDLDEQFIEALSLWDEPGLDEEGVRAYLDYRHQRPDAAITTYEEGRIARLLRGHAHPSRATDPVERESHVDPVEVFGAGRLHLTHAKTYTAIMVVLTFLFVIALLLLVL